MTQQKEDIERIIQTHNRYTQIHIHKNCSPILERERRHKLNLSIDAAAGDRKEREIRDFHRHTTTTRMKTLNEER